MIHRAGTDIVNWYLLEEGGKVTIVDAGCVTDAQMLYYGHGDPWRGGAAAAVAEARTRDTRAA